MNEGDMLRIKVPGSTANLGPGFDSIGLALGKYLTLEVTLAEELEFFPMDEHMKDVPSGADNLIAQVAIQVAKDYGTNLPPCQIKVWSEIPMARGIGSSASAIVAGIELANHLCSLELENNEKLRIASLLEGHPDNVGASVYGGLVIGLHQKNGTELVLINELDFDIVIVIPPYEVLTSDARAVLPHTLDYKVAVEASAVSNMLVAALLTKNWTLAGKMMKSDLLHQPYREELIPEIKDVQQKATEFGAWGSALSGAGPTLICFTGNGKGRLLEKQLRNEFPDSEVESVAIDFGGCVVEKLKTKNRQIL
ncbi:homoserine kinase [Metabacillus herbersteinensis]|uniref:Homoserine kinase n=1 Tax=Metabacillus herbersteinensis TaxID=283816 RepID=A0ABV6GB75_9BACI